MDFEKTDLGIDLIANALRGSMESTGLFSIFSSLFSVHHLFFRKTEGGLFLFTLKG